MPGPASGGSHGRKSSARPLGCRTRFRVCDSRYRAGRVSAAYGRQGGAERRPDHSGQCRRTARHLQEARARPEDRRFHRRQQNDSGHGRRQPRHRRWRGHGDGADRQGGADDRDLRNRGADSVHRHRRAVGFADQDDRPAQRQEDRLLQRRFADRLADQGAGAQAGMAAAGRHAGYRSATAPRASSRRSANISSTPMSP